MLFRSKFIRILAIAMAVLILPGCGSEPSEADTGQSAPEYKDALEVLSAITGVYKEDELFSHYGGDQENAVMDAPGTFDLTKTDELDTVLGMPESEAEKIEDAASMVHMMNANTFTGAAYRLKDGTDPEAFVDAVKSNILARQWICGQPDTLVILDAGGGYVITAFGEAETIELFKSNALSALNGAEVMTETPIA